MRKSKMPKTNDPFKILKMISREEEFERNGGGQWVSKDRHHKNKKKYNRKDEKRGMRKNLISLFDFYKINIF